MKLGDTLFNGNQFKNVILNSTSYKRLILGVNLVWSYFSIAIKSFKTRILADGGTYESESILEDRLQEITPNLFDSASLVITPNGVKTSKLYTIKPNDGTGDLTVVRNTSATRIDENGNIVDVPANIARIDYSTGQPAILVEPQRTNLVFPSNIATTQVRAVTAQAYTLSFYGTGYVTLSDAYSGTLNGTGANNRVSLTFTPTAGNLTLTVSGSVTNWQLEAGTNATSLIKTVSGSVTRNADIISNTNASNLIGQNEGSIYLEFFYVNSTIVNYEIFNVLYNVGTAYYLIRIRSYLLNVLSTSYANGGSAQTLLPNFSPIINSINKILIIYDKSNNTSKLFANGVFIGSKVGTENYPSISMDKIGVGNWFGVSNTSNFNLISFWKTKITDSQAIQLTTL